jgi:hypothetical protein
VGAVSDIRAAEIGDTRFADTLVTELLPESVSQITEIFDRMGVAGWLEQNPFSSLEFSPSITIGTREYGGWYDFPTQSAAIALSKTPDEYGQELIWGKISKLGVAAATPDEAVQRTLVHELGHHIHKKLGNMDSRAFNMIVRAVTSNGGSHYSRKNGLEYFAESFSAYTFHRTELIFHDQLGYDMIERALKTLGIEVAEL